MTNITHFSAETLDHLVAGQIKARIRAGLRVYRMYDFCTPLISIQLSQRETEFVQANGIGSLDDGSLDWKVDHLEGDRLFLKILRTHQVAA